MRTSWILCGTLIGLAVSAGPAAAESRQIALTGTGSAAVAGCADGGSPPCSIKRLTYAGEVTGSPFSDFHQFRQPALLSGHLDLPAAHFDARSGCFSGVTGVFELSTRHGIRSFLAFAENVSGTYCTNGGGGSFTGAYGVDSSGTQDPHFRDATGSGAMTLQDDLDLAAAGSTGSFSRDDGGVIETRR